MMKRLYIRENGAYKVQMFSSREEVLSMEVDNCRGLNQLLKHIQKVYGHYIPKGYRLVITDLGTQDTGLYRITRGVDNVATLTRVSTTTRYSVYRAEVSWLDITSGKKLVQVIYQENLDTCLDRARRVAASPRGEGVVYAGTIVNELTHAKPVPIDF